jgi:GWxTD domain-containing protein
LRKLLSFLVLAAALPGAAPSWLDRVGPVITSAEKKTYLSLPADRRREFEENFWTNKAIAGDEYFTRLEYIDSTFGSGKVGSGANTDQGRVYLSIGPPTKVTRLASSRIFVPMEIWYYDVVPGVLNTELRLIFYQKNSVGFPKLYSPTVDTIRALLLPEASTAHMFGPNDSTTENDIRQNLIVPPAEDEVISAAANVATGIKYSGNDEILGLVSSPQAMLGKPQKTDVRSRLIVSHPKLDILESASEYGGSQVDLRLEVNVAHELDMEVLDGDLPVYQNRLHVNFTRAEAVAYTHRLDLLPGSYRVILTVDGKPNPYMLEVAQHSGLGEIYRTDQADASDRRLTPFQFSDKQWEMNPDGKFAVVSLSHPGKVTWRIRRGWEVVWKSVSEPASVASVALPVTELAPGTYMLEAATESDSRSVELVLRPEQRNATKPTVLSYNANLAPALRFAFIGHQWLLRNNFDEARKSLQASLHKGATDDARIELARADALTGNLDAARDGVRAVLARKPDHFEALSVFAYIETRLQDYAVAADLYRRALAVQDSPALRVALAKLPQQ